jgi:hypothetical protein
MVKATFVCALARLLQTLIWVRDPGFLCLHGRWFRRGRTCEIAGPTLFHPRDHLFRLAAFFHRCRYDRR